MFIILMIGSLVFVPALSYYRHISPIIVPAFHWNHLNPIFQKNATRRLCTDPAHIYVRPRAEMNFICPHIALDMALSEDRLDRFYLYENIHLVSKKGFETCTVDRPKSLFMNCDKPERIHEIKYSFVMFSIVMWNGWEFFANHTYYFINTSNGTKEGLNNKSGGKCKTHNMKLKVTICAHDECDKCENMCCEKPPTTPPMTTIRTTTSPTNRTSTESITKPMSLHNTLSSSIKNRSVFESTKMTKTINRNSNQTSTHMLVKTPETRLTTSESFDEKSDPNGSDDNLRLNVNPFAVNKTMLAASRQERIEVRRINEPWVIVVAAVAGLFVGFTISVLFLRYFLVKPLMRRYHNARSDGSAANKKTEKAVYARCQSVSSSGSTEPTIV